MRSLFVPLAVSACCCLPAMAAAADPLPFSYKVEVYRNQENDVAVFSLRLEQPFLAEEFEASNYLRLQATGEQAYLIYPKETKFHQKHAEFFGRLRGEGKARLRLSYETVRENLDGSRHVDTSHGDIEIEIPGEDGGPQGLFTEWADRQNAHFLDLLRYYPEESFLQYCLLQSRDRYGVTPPSLAEVRSQPAELETDLYQVFTGSLAIQESLQRQTLGGGGGPGDLNIHTSALSPPRLQSPDYEDLLSRKIANENVEPAPHEMARLVPEDMYFLHFNSMAAAGELMDFSTQWGDSLLRLVAVRARDNRLQDKLEDQLCLRRGPLEKLFADRVVSEMAVAGSDPFVVEGTDVTLIFKLAQAERFHEAAAGWLAEVQEKHPEMVQREFNYRGHKVQVRYTDDRVVSSFVVEHDDYVVYSNSHRAVRAVVDAALGRSPRLYDSADYRYVTAILPPSDDARSGYFFGSEAFIKRNVGPEAKISEKRRLLCFNNLVMLNNASMFYRLEHRRSPASISDLVDGKFVDPAKVVCPHGGAYAFDAENDACTCSLHNRLKHLTPNSELSVERVSAAEQQEYERYKQRYEAFWQTLFDPLAARITVDRRVKIELCVLPLANSSLYQDLKASLDEKPQQLDTGRIASSAIASLAAVPGRGRIGDVLRQLPGVNEVLEADPTLTGLGWLGDRASLHLCDEDMVLEIDPTRLRPLDVAGLDAPAGVQAAVAAAIWSLEMPLYVTIDVEDRDKGARLLDQLSTKIFLRGADLLGVPTRLDAYRLPDYRQHAVYVISYQIHALKVRLHVALVGDQLVAATKPETLRQVIDAAANPAAGEPVEAHALLRLNRRAIDQLADELELYWAEKARLACHRNTMSIHNLLKLYDVPVDEVPRLSEAKYGVTYFCPDEGAYAYDPERDQVECTVHGNRQRARQTPRLQERSSFQRFFEGLDEIVASLRFRDDALIATVEIARAADDEGQDSE